ncbi:hypothetical protein [Glycomyces paridis]|uniref:Uncharacterized protein n=1 Tax=Glycomyces paridis TaxID=2126555 RepID=A0A4S8NWE2_9ACTN|nr:hypothetical protein [Glycomyces paridis]THV21768.1 hypothetical protein E9998_24265 [Glycomyces paridis]
MNDQYRISAPRQAPPAAGDHYKLTSSALWIGLVGGAAFNVGLQAVGLWLLAIPFGAMAAVSGIALIVRALVSGKRR